MAPLTPTLGLWISASPPPLCLALGRAGIVQTYAEHLREGTCAASITGTSMSSCISYSSDNTRVWPPPSASTHKHLLMLLQGQDCASLC